MFGNDAATFLADFGDPVSWTPSTGGAVVADRMIFDQPEDPIDGGEVQSRQYMVTFATTTWPGLKRGEALVISGTGGGGTYKLRTDPRGRDDGVFSVVMLTKA